MISEPFFEGSTGRRACHIFTPYPLPRLQPGIVLAPDMRTGGNPTWTSREFVFADEDIMRSVNGGKK